MNILELLGAMNKAGAIAEFGRDVADQFGPAKQALEDMRFQIADKMGMTKEMVDEGDASLYKVIDEDAFGKSMKGLSDTASQMRPQMPEPMQMPNPQPLQPQSMSMPMAPQQAPNPYAPVDYGRMSQQPQMGGIGSAPSMEQILRALQSQQR